MIRYISIFLLLSFSVSMNAQEAYKKDVYGFKINSRTRQGKIDKVTSYNQIKELKEGVLLVRLKTREKSIAALQNKGNASMAAAIKAKQSILNDKLIEAFKEGFTYCPVYFIYSYDSKKVIDKEFESVNFVYGRPNSGDLEKLKRGDFFTVEYGKVQRNITDYRDSTNQITYTYGSDLDYEALVMMNNNFRQLQKPFPSGIRGADDFTRLVQFLERNLLRFEKVADSKLNRLLYRKNKKEERQEKRAARKANRD